MKLCSHWLLAAALVGTGLVTSVVAQDEKPPEGAIVTGTPAPRTGEWTEKYLKFPDGVWFHYYELGSKGPPVLLLHGLGSTGFANWINVGIAQALAETNKVYVPDMRYGARRQDRQTHRIVRRRRPGRHGQGH